MVSVDARLGLAVEVLESVSPAEVPLIHALGPDLLAAEGGNRSDGALGFGVDEVAWAVAVIPVCKAVVDLLVGLVRDAVSGEVQKGATAVLERWRSGRRAAAAASAPAEEPLPPRLLLQVQEVAYRHGLASGLDDGRARLLADAVGGAMAVGSVRPPV